MHVSLLNAEIDVAYRGPDTTVMTGARLRRSVRNGLEAIVQLWRLRAKRVGDEPKGVDLSYVIGTLLEVAVHEELKQYLDGLDKLPTSESDWEAVLARIEKVEKLK